MEEFNVGLYIFTGFLDSGKTTFLNGALNSSELNTGEKTALFVFEEGEEDFEISSDIDVHILTREDMTLFNFLDIQKKNGYERIFVEYNGMWELGDFLDQIPDNWMICQIMAFADCTTILSYNQNMRQLTYDKFNYADLIVFNRYNSSTSKEPYHKLVRAISRNNDILYENQLGEIERDDIVDPLPFDINAPVVHIEDRDYAYFYREISENQEIFDGKVVKLKGVVAYDESLGKYTFIIGRHVMVCCEADTKYCGLVVKHDGYFKPVTSRWCIVKAQIKIENHEVYGNEGPVLYARQITPCQPLDGEDVISTFY